MGTARFTALDPRLPCSDGDDPTGLEPALPGAIQPVTRMRLKSRRRRYVDGVLKRMCGTPVNGGDWPHLDGGDLVIPHNGLVRHFVQRVIYGVEISCGGQEFAYERKWAERFAADIAVALAVDGCCPKPRQEGVAWFRRSSLECRITG